MWCNLIRLSPGTKFLDSKESAFCVACGNATCSSNCHTHYFERTDKCTYHQHFIDSAPIKQLRSLTLQNINFAQNEQLSPGTLLNRTSRNYFFGMAHPDQGFIYAQRGFRQYGPIGVRLTRQTPLKHSPFSRLIN